MTMNDTSSCCKIEQPKIPSLKRVFSQLIEQHGSTQSMLKSIVRKRPFEEEMTTKAEVSPKKKAKKENEKDENFLVMTDAEILQKGRERVRKYRCWLAQKPTTTKQYIIMRNQLCRKDELITSLKMRIAELEGSSYGDGDDNTVNSPTSTQRMLDIIRVQEEENEKLTAQVSNLEASNSILKNINNEKEPVSSTARKWSQYSNLTSMNFPKPSLTEQEIADMKHQVADQERQIQLLKTKENYLQQQLDNVEVNKSVERTLLRTIDELKVKLHKAEIECFQEQIKLTEQLADRPSMVIVETRAPKQLRTESIQVVLDKLNDVTESYTALRKHVSHFTMQMKGLVEVTVHKMQSAIKKTDETNKDLVSKYTREIQLRKHYHNQVVELRGNIRVYCRVRPYVSEVGPTEPTMTFDSFDDGVIVVNNKDRWQKYQMDKVFNMSCSQAQVFDEVAPLVRSAIDGFNVCIFAYGQTGSGKTHTMEGIPNDPGVNQRALQLLYEETKASSWQYTVEASMLEIYNETLRDLLSPDSNSNTLEVKMKQEGGLHVPGVLSVPVNSVQEINKVIETGKQNRSTASTCMNERSSRSHCLLCINVTGHNLITGSKTFGRLNLVDLAGSERVSKSQADGVRLKEAQNINKSLSSLSDVINALKNKHSHVPYRNSKLTYLLQESLGGDSKTLVIVQVSPEELNVSESLCTLSFGQRVRSAELGMAKKKVEDGIKGTPGHSNVETANSPMSATPSKQISNTPRASPMMSKLGSRLK